MGSPSDKGSMQVGIRYKLLPHNFSLIGFIGPRKQSWQETVKVIYYCPDGIVFDILKGLVFYQSEEILIEISCLSERTVLCYSKVDNLYEINEKENRVAIGFIQMHSKQKRWLYYLLQNIWSGEERL